MCFRIVLLIKHWKKYLSKKFQLTKNSRQCKLWKIIQLFTADAIGNTVYPSQPHFHTCHGAALNKVYWPPHEICKGEWMWMTGQNKSHIWALNNEWTRRRRLKVKAVGCGLYTHWTPVGLTEPADKWLTNKHILTLNN